MIRLLRISFVLRNWIVDSLAFDCLRRIIPARIGVVDADESEWLAGRLFYQFDIFRNRIHTWSAPCRPKINNDHFATIRSDCRWIANPCLRHDFGRGLSFKCAKCLWSVCAFIKPTVGEISASMHIACKGCIRQHKDGYKKSTNNFRE